MEQSWKGYSLEAEKELKGTNSLLESIFDNTNLYFAYLDKDFNFIRVNRAYAGSDEKDPSFFPGKNHFDLYPNKENKEIFRQVAQTGEPYYAASKAFRYENSPEREITYWDWSLIPIKDASGETDGLLLSLSNVTERKKVKEELEAQKKRAEILSDISQALAKAGLDEMQVMKIAAEKVTEFIGSGCVIKLLSDDGKMLLPVICYHKDETANSYLMNTCPNDTQDINEGLLGRAAKTGKPVLIEKVDDEVKSCVSRGYRPFISNFDVKSMLIVPLKFHEKVTGIIGVLRGRSDDEYTYDDQLLMENLADRISLAVANARLHAEKLKEIEERKQIEANLTKTLCDLESTNKELQQFAYVASHDLQEPLRMVSSYTTMLERKYGDMFDDTAKKFMGFVVEGAKRMQMLIMDLLDYSRISSKDRTLGRVDCNSVVKKVLDSLSLQIQESRAKVYHDFLPVVMADQVHMTQLFQNLISNAIKFKANEDPEVHVSCIDEQTRWRFSVKDNGIGIGQEYFDRIFVIFQRLHVRDEYPGTGIGLTICKKIVEQHGGEIWVESNEGKGTTFHFTIAK